MQPRMHDANDKRPAKRQEIAIPHIEVVIELSMSHDTGREIGDINRIGF